jgi:LysR family transcriptional regulator, cys regulon transcriptional activator
MNLQQLRYIREVVRQDFNISAASETLHTAQPGISHQIKRLEDELGVAIFDRHGKRLTGLTQPGRAVVAMAERILREIEQMRELSAEFAHEETGQLAIATTHTQARYSLPKVIRQFIERYPHISLQIHQGRPDQIAQWVARGVADIGLATEGLMNSPDLIALPCYEWNHCLIAPPGLPLLRKHPLTLDDIAEYPIVTYDKAIAGRERIDEAFANRAIRPKIALSAIDSDVIKTYVEIGLGVGIIARMAFDPERDPNLRMLDASHLFAASTSYIALRRGLPPRNFLYAFIAMLSPQLDRATIDEAMNR